VVTDSKNGPRSGKALEVVGAYDSREDGGNKNNNRFDAERIKHWIKNGAQVSDTVHNLLISEKIIEGKKVNVLPKRTPIVKEVKEGAKAPTAPVVSEPAPEEKTEAPKEEPKMEEVKPEVVAETSETETSVETPAEAPAKA